MSFSQETQSLSESLGKNSSSPTISIGRRSQVDKENEQERSRGASFNLSGVDDVGDDLGMDPDDSLMDSFLSSHSREFSDFISQDIVDSPGGQSSVSQAISDSDFRVKKTLDASAADIRLLAGMSKTPEPARQSKAGGSVQEGAHTAPMARRAPEYMSPRQRAKLIESPISNSIGVQSSPLRAPSTWERAPKKAQLISSASSSFIATRSIFESQSQPQSTKKTRSGSPMVPPSPELGVQYSVGPMTEDFELAQTKYDSDHSQELYGTSPRGSKDRMAMIPTLDLSYSSSESEYPDADDFLADRSALSTTKPLNMSDADKEPEKQDQSDQVEGRKVSSSAKMVETNGAGDTSTNDQPIALRLRTTPQRSDNSGRIQDLGPEKQNQNGQASGRETNGSAATTRSNEDAKKISTDEEPLMPKLRLGKQSLGKRRRTQDSEPEYGSEAVPVLPSDNSNESTYSPSESGARSPAQHLSPDSQAVGVFKAKTPAPKSRRLKDITWSSPKRIKLSSGPINLRKSISKGHDSLGGAASVEALTPGRLGKRNSYPVPTTRSLTTRSLQKAQSLLGNDSVQAQVESQAENMGHDLITPTTAVLHDSPSSDREAGSDVDADVDIVGAGTANNGQVEESSDADIDIEGQSSDSTLPDADDSNSTDIATQNSPSKGLATEPVAEAPRQAKALDSEHVRYAADESDSSEPESVELELEDTTPRKGKGMDFRASSPGTAPSSQSNGKVIDEADGEANKELSQEDESDKETDKVSSDESDAENKGEEGPANDSNSDSENWHPAAEILDTSDEWRPESSEIPNVPQPKIAETPSPLKSVRLPPVPATAATIKQPVSMLASAARRVTKKTDVPKTQPAPSRQRRLSSSRPVSMCQRLIRLHELTKDKGGVDDVTQSSGLLSLIGNGRASADNPSTKQSAPPSPVRSATFSGTMRVFGEGVPELSDSERLNYMRKVKGLIEGTTMTAKEALRILYFFTGDWVGARKYIAAGCAQPAASAGACMWTATDDEVLVQGMSSSMVEDLRQRKGNVEVYRRLQFLNTFHGAKS